MRPKSVDIQTYRREYRAYHDAKQRCTNTNHPRYSDWGGRGISFCLPKFQDFIAYIGPVPDGYSIDRIDNNGNYTLTNVRWNSANNQQHNKRLDKRNKFGIAGIKRVNAPGLITPTYGARMMINGKTLSLYCGPDFFEACCARKAMEHKRNTHE